MLINTQPRRDELISLFTKTKQLPKLLITHNTPEMNKAFYMVSQAIWMQRLDNLQLTLRNREVDEGTRRFMILSNENEMIEPLNEMLSNAFLTKYEELALKAKYDFDNFFPYSVKSFNSKMVIFELMPSMLLTDYVIHHRF